MKFYIQSQDASIDFCVDCCTPGEALAMALTRHIENGCRDIVAVYSWHMGRSLDASPIPSSECYWHLRDDHRKILSRAIREQFPEIYLLWCDRIVAGAPDDDEEEEY